MKHTYNIKRHCTHYLLMLMAFLIMESYGQDTWVDSTSLNGNAIRMRVNPKTGVPNRVVGLVVNFNRYGSISENNIQGLSRSFLAEYNALLKINLGSLRLEKAENRKGRWHVTFVQEKRGVPVYNGRVGFTVFENGNVPIVRVDYYPDIDINTTPAISAQDALDIASTNFLQLSQADSMEIRKKPKLVILPIEGDEIYDYYLAYHV